MVILNVKKGDQSQFLFSTKTEVKNEDLIKDVVVIYNGRLKVHRICYEMEELAKHGPMFPPDILGLLEEQVAELKLTDEWGDKCIPQDGFELNKDPVGRRNGKRPKEKQRDVLLRIVEEAKGIISKKKVEANVSLALKDVQEALEILKGAAMIVYPMGLPPHEPIRKELENTEDLTGTQAALEVLDVAKARLWFSGKEILPGKKLKDYIGSNEKTKIVVKLSSASEGAPSREPVFTEQQRKEMMLAEYKRREEIKKLEEDEDDSYYNSSWADNSTLKRSFQGLNNISWRPK